MASNGLAHAMRKSRAMGPSVRNLINQYNLDPSQIQSSGPHQTLLKSDVLGYLNQRSNPKATTNLAADEMRAQVTLSAAKPPTAASQLRGHETTYISSLANGRFARRQLEPLEIEVINSGGIIDPPETGQKTSSKSRQR